MSTQLRNPFLQLLDSIILPRLDPFRFPRHSFSNSNTRLLLSTSTHAASTLYSRPTNPLASSHCQVARFNISKYREDLEHSYSMPDTSYFCHHLPTPQPAHLNDALRLAMPILLALNITITTGQAIDPCIVTPRHLLPDHNSPIGIPLLGQAPPATSRLRQVWAELHTREGRHGSLSLCRSNANMPQAGSRRIIPREVGCSRGRLQPQLDARSKT